MMEQGSLGPNAQVESPVFNSDEGKYIHNRERKGRVYKCRGGQVDRYSRVKMRKLSFDCFYFSQVIN